MYVDNNVDAGFVFCLSLISSPLAKPATHDPSQLPLMHVGEAPGLWGNRMVLTGLGQEKPRGWRSDSVLLHKVSK